MHNETITPENTHFLHGILPYSKSTLTQVVLQHKKAHTVHILTWLTCVIKHSAHKTSSVSKDYLWLQAESWNGYSISVTDTSVSFVTDVMELKNIQIKWKHTLTLILQVLIFHPTYYFATGCYCSWCQCYQLLIEHTFMNICVHEVCTQSRNCASAYTYRAQSSPRTHTHIIFWNQTISVLKPEIVGHVPHAVGRETCAR